MKLITKIFALVLTTLTLVSCSSFQPKNLSEKITAIYVNELAKVYEKKGQKCDISSMIKEHYVEKYVGHKDDIYAVVFHYDSHPWLGDWSNICINDYCSEAMYRTGAFPYVYKNESIYSYDKAYDEGVIDLDFIKTFDEFQKQHTPKELEEIPV